MPTLDQLPRFYGYRDVLACFGEDQDAFVDAFCDDTLPPAVRQTCLDTMGERLLEVWLLRRLVRQMHELLVESRKPFEFPVAPGRP